MFLAALAALCSIPTLTTDWLTLLTDWLMVMDLKFWQCFYFTLTDLSRACILVYFLVGGMMLNANGVFQMITDRVLCFPLDELHLLSSHQPMRVKHPNGTSSNKTSQWNINVEHYFTQQQTFFLQPPFESEFSKCIVCIARLFLKLYFVKVFFTVMCILKQLCTYTIWVNESYSKSAFS